MIFFVRISDDNVYHFLGHGIYCGDHDATTSVQGDTC